MPRKRKAPEEEPSEDLSKLTVAALKKLCEERGLDSKGKKQELLDRLETKSDKKAPKLEKQSTLEAAAERVLETAPGKKKHFKVDTQCPVAHGGKIHKDFDCTLNQTNIGNNNNKYYLIQLIALNKTFHVWNRWGRVGQVTGVALSNPQGLDDAIKEFKKKFRDKTKNDWDKRSNFVSHPGKYTLLEMGDDEEEEADKPSSSKKPKLEDEAELECSLDAATRDLIQYILDGETFQQAMATMGLDQKRLPLGKLSKTQIAKGFQVLDDLRNALRNKKSRTVLEELSNQYYTLIPHAVGFTRLPVLNTDDAIKKKVEDLCDLADIELVQTLQKDSKAKKEEKLHQLDAKYELLECDLDLLSATSKEHKVLMKYLESSKGHCVQGVKNIWKVTRRSDGERFKTQDHLDNRRLLWHGTNVAVVAAILKQGLRIMPQRCQGIFHASDNVKSIGYVRPIKKRGIMFLNEVVLGKAKDIPLGKPGWHEPPPKGFNSVIARGKTEPDPSKDTSLVFDGQKVAVPQGSPVPMPKFSDSYDPISEYIVYKEAQVRIRYLLLMDWAY